VISLNNNERDSLANLFAKMRTEGAILSEPLLDLHERICQEQILEDARRQDLVAELARWEGMLVSGEYRFVHYRVDVPATLSLSAADKRRIKKFNGSYSECRGYANTRFVNLRHNEENLALALDLANRSLDSRHSLILITASYRHHRVLYPRGPWTRERVMECTTTLAQSEIKDRIEEIRKQLAQFVPAT